MKIEFKEIDIFVDDLITEHTSEVDEGKAM